MTEEFDQVVKVLYDYKYSDEAGEIQIRNGDIYRLVEKTNNEWWQVYDPSDADGESFFVPAQYVEIVHEESPWKALSDLDKALTFGDERSASPKPDYNDDPSDLYSTAASATSGRPIIPNTDDAYININSGGVGDQGDRDGEYINLDSYRTAAGIPSLSSASPESPNNTAGSSVTKPNIPQELIQGTMPPPMPEEGTYVKVLLEGLPWDIYREHTAGRLFYVNRDTGERMWKPPRKPIPQQSGSKMPEEASTRFGSSSSPVTKEPLSAGLPSQYEQIHDNGNIYFIHKGTQEKWKSLVDKIGRQYFHKLGSSDTQWTLPDPSATEDKELALQVSGNLYGSEQSMQQPDVHWEGQGHRLSTFGGNPAPLSRSTKAASTYGHLEVAPKTGNRASTLPANFTVARPAPVAHERGLTSAASQFQRMPSPPTSSRPTVPAQDEVLAGYLNKAKILDTGKKKVKKNWAQIYLVLRGSNLIFYKDQKSASNDARNEGVVSLQGAHVNFNPPKDLTSRKNSILLQASSGNLFLFQSDNEKSIREWFTRMKIVANDVSSEFDSSPISFDVKEEKKDDKKSEKTTHRSISSDDGVSIHSVDKNKNLVGIRAKLLSLISRRPTQEDLYKRGIIKDAVFGSRLPELCDKEKTHVPHFVHHCILAVESKGLLHDGLYRVSGNLAEIQRLRCAVDKDDNYNLYDAQWDVHVLTGSLKLFFRELKEPVFPFHMYNTFLQAIGKESSKDRSSAFKKAVSDLPRCNYFTLKELFQHLCKIIELSHENRMQVQNVAIVFGPTLMWQQEEGVSLAVSTMYQSKIVEYMLLEFSSLFKH